MISTNEFRAGAAIFVDGQLYTIVEYQHVKPGKGGAFVRTKLRKVKGAGVVERTFKVGEKFEDAFIEKRKFQFLYKTGDAFHFMDQSSYEDLELKEETLGPSAGFLKENMEIEAQFCNGEIIGLDLPIFVDLKITETGPGIRGDTAKAGTKPAVLETGATVQVPLFVESGEVVRVDTRTSTYIGRA